MAKPRATKTSPPPPSDIFEHLQYVPEFGHFIWSQRMGGRPFGKVAGNFDWDGYREICFRGTIYKVAALVWLAETGEWPRFKIDHKDTNKSNDRFSNLRKATQSQNMANVGKIRKDTASSQYKGVHRSAGKWVASIRVEGRYRRLGTYAREEDAAEAYREAATAAWGEFARFQ